MEIEEVGGFASEPNTNLDLQQVKNGEDPKGVSISRLDRNVLGSASCSTRSLRRLCP